MNNYNNNKSRDSSLWADNEGQLPEYEGNPEFELLDPELQTVIAERFERGIALTAEKDRLAREGLIKAGADARKRWHDREARKLQTVTLGAALPELGNRYRKQKGKRS